jgi:PAS domain S-box-containing protein
MTDRAESIRVLHVDDDPAFAEVTATFLERQDDRITVTSVESAAAGRERLANDEFDCIVSDYEMPAENGIEFLESIREMYPDLPFILFTGRGSEAVASDAISAGVTDYLRKRSGTEQYELLARRVETAVGQYRAERELERQNDLFRKTQSLANVGGWEWYPQREEGYYSEQVYEIYGVDSRAGSTPEKDLQEFFHPADHERLRTAYQTAIEAGESYDIEVRVITADGSLKWVRTRGKPEFEDGTCVRISGTIQDITDQKATEERLAAYAENTTDIVAVIDDGVFVDLAASVERVLGYESAELEGERLLEYVHPADRGRVSEWYEQSVADARVGYRFRGTDGSWTPVESTMGAESALGGQVVTTRKRTDDGADRELERTRDLLAKTERIADVGGWEVDPETREVFWTDPLFDLLGIDGDEEPPLDDALELYHEDDRHIVADAVESALEDGDPFDVTVRFHRQGSNHRWLRVQGTPTTEDGTVTTLRGAVQDITEQRRRERVLREMHEIVSDRDQSFEQQVQALLELGRTELNTQYGTLSKIEGDEYIFEIVATDDDSIQTGDVVPVSATNCEIAASTEQTLVLGDVERDAPSETDRAGYTDWGIACYLGSPVFVDDGVYGTFCFYGTEPREGQFSEWEVTIVDLMSRWVGYELQRERVTERLKETNEQLEQFASIVSHDLRNPLNVIGLEADLATEECNSDHLDAVVDAHERMETLIEDLLTLAREGETVDEFEAVELTMIAKQCWATVETVDAEIVVDSERIIEADASRLKHVFENLFRNAVEHAGSGVTVRIGDLDNGFYVEDDGSGIAEKNRQAVFETGYSTSGAQTGFGMSIVRQIVDAHGWSIQIVEEETGGARFEITGVEFVD